MLLLCFSFFLWAALLFLVNHTRELSSVCKCVVLCCVLFFKIRVYSLLTIGAVGEDDKSEASFQYLSDWVPRGGLSE